MDETIICLRKDRYNGESIIKSSFRRQNIVEPLCLDKISKELVWESIKVGAKIFSNEIDCYSLCILVSTIGGKYFVECLDSALGGKFCLNFFGSCLYLSLHPSTSFRQHMFEDCDAFKQNFIVFLQLQKLLILRACGVFERLF